MGRDYKQAIAASGLTIYDPIKVGDPDLWVPTPELESLLDERLRGISLAGYALRTRSKVVKEHVCRALGYPVPPSFKKTQPRFVGQMFDTYAQKANNLQVWNEELSPSRRYVILRVDEADQVARVKVVNGEELAQLDTTGTLTQKYQARLVPGDPCIVRNGGPRSCLLPPVRRSASRLRRRRPCENRQNQKRQPEPACGLHGVYPFDGSGLSCGCIDRIPAASESVALCRSMSQAAWRDLPEASHGRAPVALGSDR
ncbi:hypothetical protein EV655_1155 [Rhodovulum euryhalinum]|uniref:Uncharacterized protein n=1 Tax=Rhodovulum euryhalinum TaxID=35805 RepID=A0A4R2KG18_9RHOB|nr:hypothetical protein EV655_1155 [Rhodovulum euryhalinum]